MKGGGCISEVSFKKGVTVYSFYLALFRYGSSMYMYMCISLRLVTFVKLYNFLNFLLLY